MSIAIVPGTFDPLTNGHLDIIRRAAHLFDEVIVLLAVNAGKTPIFKLAQRRELVEACITGMPRVCVDTHDGLLVEYAQRVGAAALVRGLRAISDFENEFQMASVNRRLAPDIETVFLTPTHEWTYLNASLVRELWRFGGDFSAFVPEPVLAAMQKLKEASTRS